jgi:hypothetical protein
VERIGLEEVFVVVEGEGPEAVDGRSLSGRKGDGVGVSAVKALIGGGKIGVDAAGFLRGVVIRIGFRGGCAGKIVISPVGSIGRRVPAVADGASVPVKVEERTARKATEGYLRAFLPGAPASWTSASPSLEE